MSTELPTVKWRHPTDDERPLAEIMAAAQGGPITATEVVKRNEVEAARVEVRYAERLLVLAIADAEVRRKGW